MPGSKQHVLSSAEDGPDAAQPKLADQSGKKSERTAGFLRFIENHPNKKTVIEKLDTAVRKHLGRKYLDFNQGCYAVVQHRANQNAANALQPGVQDDASINDKSLRPKYWCSACNKFKVDITRHLATHNKDPKRQVYCPHCLRGMAEDACTLPEHMMNCHPERIIDQPNPVQNSERYQAMATTTKHTQLNRLGPSAIRAFITQDHFIFEHLLEGFLAKHQVVLSNLEEVNTVFGLATHHQLNLSKLIETVRRLYAVYGNDAGISSNGLIAKTGINALKKPDGIQYLQGLREALISLQHAH